jgi:nucleoside-diphosphate-sugar epimerase
MSIVVIRGAGLIGSELVEKLRRHAHDPLGTFPGSRGDAFAGQQFAEALARAKLVIGRGIRRGCLTRGRIRRELRCTTPTIS